MISHRAINVEYDDSNNAFYVYVVRLELSGDVRDLFHSTFASKGAAMNFFYHMGDGEWQRREVGTANEHWYLALMPGNPLSAEGVTIYQTLLVTR